MRKYRGDCMSNILERGREMESGAQVEKVAGASTIHPYGSEG